jgi:hypothetical protein
MKSYVKLVNFEIDRFAKLYGLLLVVIFLLQTGTVMVMSKMYMRHTIGMIKSGELELEYAKFGLSNVTFTLGFTAPIFIGIAAILFYIFFIWYRDWFARNAFIYRLLTLPTSRMTVYFAKLTTIMFAVFGLVAYQIVLLTFFTGLIKWFVPITYREDLPVIDIVVGSPYFNILVPDSVATFFISYGVGLAFVIVVFTMILLERSYKLKGIAMGILYFGFCIFIMLIPVLIQIVIGKFYLYPGELFMAELGILLLLVGLSLWLSRYLLKYKVTV